MRSDFPRDLKSPCPSTIGAPCGFFAGSQDDFPPFSAALWRFCSELADWFGKLPLAQNGTRYRRIGSGGEVLRWGKIAWRPIFTGRHSRLPYALASLGPFAIRAPCGIFSGSQDDFRLSSSSFYH